MVPSTSKDVEGRRIEPPGLKELKRLSINKIELFRFFLVDRC
jgi:hypothetical protein